MQNDQHGRVASLYLHPLKAGDPLEPVEAIDVIEAKGILNEPRYFGRLSRKTGQLSQRQVTLIERDQISQHAKALGLASIPPGAVRSNIETQGINLIALLGSEIEIGEAVLLLYAPRRPGDDGWPGSWRRVWSRPSSPGTSRHQCSSRVHRASPRVPMAGRLRV